MAENHSTVNRSDNGSAGGSAIGSVNFLDIYGRSRENLQSILDTARSHAARIRNGAPKSQLLANKTVASLFFEDSTRTRLSFERAARQLSADVFTFSAGGSSLKKGESLRDTVQTLDAMGVDAYVVRHSSPGVPHQISRWTSACVLNAGDGAHEHPTQALIDCFALTERLRRTDLEGVRIAIVGDINNSRVARSNVWAFTALGAEVRLVAPRTMLPANIEDWPVAVTSNFNEVVDEVDVFYMLRIQKERATNSAFPSLNEYVTRFSLDLARFKALRSNQLIMHPGPMNRGVEIAAAAADSSQSLVTHQVAAGVPVRMAALELCLTGKIDQFSTNQLATSSSAVRATAERPANHE